MASAGTVTVDFAAETAKFTAELKKVRSDLAILRKDSALVSQTLGKFGSTFRGLVTIGSVLGAVRAVVRATSEAEAAQAQLNSALAAAGANVNAASAEFQRYATQLQRTTTFGDEAIMQVQTLLLSFSGLSGDVVRRATESVLDLSTRMGIDAPAAAKLLGKALSDPEKGLTALTRAGVTFTASERERIKAMTDAGALAEAQEFVLAKLQDRFGGAASAARNTFGGALASLNNAFGDLLEGKGGINATADAINELTEVLLREDVKEGFANLISGLARAVEFGAKLAAGIAGLARETGEFFARLNSGELAPEFLESVEEVDSAIRRLRVTRIQAEQAFFQGAMTDRAEQQLEEGLRDIDAKISRLEARRRELEQAPPPAPAGAPEIDSDALNFTTGGVNDEISENERRAAEERLRTQERIGELIYNNEMKLIQSIIDDGNELIAADMAADSEEFQANLQRRIDAEQAAADERFSIESDLQAQLLDLRQGAVNSAIGLLQFLSQRSKTAAIALILVNRALSIAQVVQNTAAAATKALAVYGPTPAGFAAAASAKAFGAVQIGLIAATGALEVASVGSGGGGPAVAPGTPNNPIYTRDDNETTPGATSQRAVQLVFAGPVYGMDDFKDQLVEMLREEVDERDVLIISPNSRQAQELRESA